MSQRILTIDISVGAFLHDVVYNVINMLLWVIYYKVAKICFCKIECTEKSILGLYCHKPKMWRIALILLEFFFTHHSELNYQSYLSPIANPELLGLRSRKIQQPSGLAPYYGSFRKGVPGPEHFHLFLWRVHVWISIILSGT